MLLGQHLLHRRGHAARRGEVLAVFAALLHAAGSHRLRVNVFRDEHRVQLVERQHEIRADLPRVLIPLDLALFGDARANEHDRRAGVLLLDIARRRHHRGDGVADLIEQRRVMLGDHVIESRAAAGGHVAALARNLLRLLRFIIGRRVRAEGNLHRVREAQMLKRADHLADAHTAELALDGRGEAGVDLLLFVADGFNDVRNHGNVGDGGERTGHGAVAAGNTLIIIDERAAILFIDRDRVHRAGAHAGTARIGDGVIRARLRAHAALAALIRVDDRALMGHGNRTEAAGLQAALSHAVLAVAGDGIALQGAALAGAVHDGDGLIGEGIVIFAIIDGRAAAGPIHAVTQHLAFAVDAAAMRGLASVRHDFQRNELFMGFQRAFKAIFRDVDEHLALTVNTLDHIFPP